MKKSVYIILILSVITFSGCSVSEISRYTVPTESSHSLISSHEKPAPEVNESLQETHGESKENVFSIEDNEKCRAEKILSEMTLEEKIGQVIIARYPENAAEQMAKYKFGGYTLYAKDFENHTPESIAAELDAVKSRNPIAPFIAADEEGGSITRVSRYEAFAEVPLPSVQEALALGTTMDEWTEQMADALRKAGVNLNFAPVADVAESDSAYIYNRTVGLGYEETGAVIAEIIEGMNRQGIMSCLKHFPGYGSNADTHTGSSVDNRTAEEFEKNAFVPFVKGIEAGAPLVMINHSIVTAYNEELPASLAPEVHEALRSLGFEGIIVTDDLGMDAITLYTDNSYTAAFLAGNDLICTSDGEACFNALYEAVKSGEITQNRLNESVLRILRQKIVYNLIV